MSGATTPTATEAPALDDRDVEPRTPMKRLGSTRKLAAFNNIRMQLSEQTRVLEARAEATAGVAGELHDYCRRRADLEHDYARALDKLARAAHQRHKDQKHKREQWSLTGAYACWQAALDSTRALSRDHAALAELYAGPLATRLQRAADDALRLHRKCRDIVAERHEEVGAALAEAAGAGKAHAAAAAEWRGAALKLRHAYDQRQRVVAADPPRHKKLKALDKELDKRRTRHSEARVRALRARADYVLSLEAANATLQRYYLDDIADIILCMEVGFEAVVARVVRTAGAAEAARAGAAGAAARALGDAARALDALQERQRLLDAHAAAFALPRPLPLAAPAPDAELRDLLADAADEHDEAGERVARELRARLAQLDAGARELRAECRENAKTLDAAEAELVKQMEGSDSMWDVSGLFGAGAAGGARVPPGAAPVPDDQEDYYLAKFRSYVACAGRLARLESKSAAVRGRLAGVRGAAGRAPAGGADVVRARHRHVRAAPPGRVPRVGLAGGDAGAARGLRARRGPAGRRARRLGHQLGVRPAEAVPARAAAAAAAAAAAGAPAARGRAARRRAVRAAHARHAGRAGAARRAGAALPVRLPRAPGGAQRAQHDGRVEPGHLPGAHAAGGVGRGRRAGDGAEPRQRAGQAHHPAPRRRVPAGHRALRALLPLRRGRGVERRGGQCGRRCTRRRGRGGRGGRREQRGRRARRGRARRARRPVALRHRRRRHRRHQRRGRGERRVGGALDGRLPQVAQRRAPRRAGGGPRARAEPRRRALHVCALQAPGREHARPGAGPARAARAGRRARRRRRHVPAQPRHAQEAAAPRRRAGGRRAGAGRGGRAGRRAAARQPGAGAQHGARGGQVRRADADGRLAQAGAGRQARAAAPPHAAPAAPAPRPRRPARPRRPRARPRPRLLAPDSDRCPLSSPAFCIDDVVENISDESHFEDVFDSSRRIRSVPSMNLISPGGGSSRSSERRCTRCILESGPRVRPRAERARDAFVRK